jgi:hypothetical protein
MERHFRWGKRKDKPTVTRVHRLKRENITKERPICFGVLAVKNYVSARDHLSLLVGLSAPVPPEGHLTVKLRGRPEAPDQAPPAHNFSPARGADTQAVHGPLQRLLGVGKNRELALALDPTTNGPQG